MSRPILLFFAIVLAWAAGFASPAWAEGHGRTVRIYMILWRGETEVEEGFRSQMRSSGFDVDYIVRNADQKLDRIPGFIEEARQFKADIVYTWGTSATVAVTKLLTDIPVVFTMVSSPQSVGLADKDDLSHRNFTGTSHLAPITLQIRAIQAYRRFHRLAVIYNPSEQNSVETVEALREQAQKQGFNLIEQPVVLDAAGHPSVGDLPRLIARVARREPQFLYLPPDSFIAANAPVITREALRYQLPTFCATEQPVRSSDALFGLVAHYTAVGRLAGRKAVAVLNGRPAGEVPIETLSRFSLMLRMHVAKELDFYPPLEMLGYAEVLP